MSAHRSPAGWLVRPWELGDAGQLRNALEAEAAERQLGAVLTTDAAAVEWIERSQQEWTAGTAFSWAVQSSAGHVVGSVAVSAINRSHDTGWISYWTATPARGQGVATEATVFIADWALTEMGLFRLELGHRIDNPASCAVAAAALLRVEGMERAKLRYGDRRDDVELYARLATDPNAPQRHS